MEAVTEIICTVITAVGAIVVAVIGKSVSNHNKRMDAQAEERVKESRLQLKMMAANTNLTLGVALALKHGHCNGEVEQGIAEVKEAQSEYIDFLENVMVDKLKR